MYGACVDHSSHQGHLSALSYFAAAVLCRLIELCEARLMAELLSMSPSAAAAEAPHLVGLADELGLVQLRRAAVAFIAQHFTDVKVGAPCT